MDDLIAFLNARLDEDAETAKAPESWTAFDENESTGTRRVDVDHSIERVVACTRAWRGVHIARYDPARALCEVAARRRIIQVMEAQMKATLSLDEAQRKWVTASATAVLRLLAAVYADHTEYRQEWAP
jgi:hypothetical protein